MIKFKEDCAVLEQGFKTNEKMGAFHSSVVFSSEGKKQKNKNKHKHKK